MQYALAAAARIGRHITDHKVVVDESTVPVGTADRVQQAIADALLFVTEWKEFRTPDFDPIKATLKRPLVFDGRNLRDPALMKSLGLEYHGIGRG